MHPIRRLRTCCLALAAAAGVSAHALDLTVVFEGAGLQEGRVQTALYDGTTPWLRDKPLRSATVAADADGRATAVFRGLPPGRYGLSAFHDADADGRFGTYPLGIPREAYGFSRNARGLMGPPSFDDAALEVRADQTITVRLK